MTRGSKVSLVLDKIRRCQNSWGQYEASAETFRQLHELREKVLGKEHPETLTSMNGLAGALSNQGKYAEAEKMHLETLALSEKVSGKEHPSTLISMKELEYVIKSRKRVPSKPMRHKALPRSKRTRSITR
jgi:hypothetical protein